MIRNKIKQWSILLYVMLLINIALVVWIVVYNNSYVIINNIDIGNNQEEIFSNIYNKADISINSVKKYNSNWGGYVDAFSCPTNVTMSGATIKTENIPTSLVISDWETYCEGLHWGKIFRIYYNDDINDFDSSTYWNDAWYSDTVNIEQSIWTDISLWTENLATKSSTSVTGPTAVASSHSLNHINDGDINTPYESENEWTFSTIFDLGEETKIWQIIIKKINRIGRPYWTHGRILLRNSVGTIDWTNYADLPYWMEQVTSHEVDFKYSWLYRETQFVELINYGWILDLLEFEIYPLVSNGTNESWVTWREFYVADSPVLTFDTEWIHWDDSIDDNLDSDNYRVTSKDDIYYPNGYVDDDVIPRKRIFWNIPAQSQYQHIYWNNYKTIKIIDENTNNVDIINKKMWDTNSAYMHLDVYNDISPEYDIKILEFDRDTYKNKYTLLPVNSNEGKWLTDFVWYIQKSSTGSLSISKEKTWNEYDFDFWNNDYAIFLSNNTDSAMSYHLESETPTWSGIYINPIDDSWSWTIKFLSNHIIIWGEKNFIWENFEVIGSK